MKSGNMDGYFVPKGLAGEFSSSGIDLRNIYESGIPVRSSFYFHADRAEAKKSFGLDENGKSVLIMCGSMGCGPIYELTESLSVALPEKVQIAVVCGSNDKLKTELEPLEGKK